MDFKSVVLRSAESRDPLAKDRMQGIDRAIGLTDSFFHGNFKKYTAALGHHNYILKVCDPSVAPELPEVEFVSNQIGAALKLPVAWFTRLDLFGSRTFVTRNFITVTHEAVNLIHIYHYLTSDQLFDCETLLNVIWRETNSPRDIETFIEMCLFDSLIGNHDRHGRNIALINSSRGARLSPIYDNPSYLGLEQGGMLRAQFEPTGRIRTQSVDNPTMKDYVAEFVRLGHEAVVDAFSARVRGVDWETMIRQSDCSNAMKNALVRLVTKRSQELIDARLL